MKSFRPVRAFFLILLLGSSFFMHTFVHHSGCCGAGARLSVRNDSVPGISRDSCTSAAAEMFCPVCAGMLNSDPVPGENQLLIPFGRTVLFTAFSDFLSTPDWRLPFSRAPPAFPSLA